MKHNLVRVGLVLLVLALGGMPTLAQKKRTTPEEAIRTADQEWLKVFAAGDLDKSVAFCTSDGSVLAPNQGVATGQAGFQASSVFQVSRSTGNLCELRSRSLVSLSPAALTR